MLAERDPCRDCGDHRLDRGGEADARGGDQPDRGEGECEWDDRRDHDDRCDLEVAVRRRLRPRQEPWRVNDAPSNKRKAEPPDEKRRGAVGLPEALAEREVQREDERVYRREREPERVELAKSCVIRAGREETSKNGERRSNPQTPADRAAA